MRTLYGKRLPRVGTAGGKPVYVVYRDVGRLNLQVGDALSEMVEGKLIVGI